MAVNFGLEQDFAEKVASHCVRFGITERSIIYEIRLGPAMVEKPKSWLVNFAWQTELQP